MQDGTSEWESYEGELCKVYGTRGHLEAEGSTGDYFTVVERRVRTGMAAEEREGRIRLQDIP